MFGQPQSLAWRPALRSFVSVWTVFSVICHQGCYFLTTLFVMFGQPQILASRPASRSFVSVWALRVCGGCFCKHASHKLDFLSMLPALPALPTLPTLPTFLPKVATCILLNDGDGHDDAGSRPRRHVFCKLHGTWLKSMRDL